MQLCLLHTVSQSNSRARFVFLCTSDFVQSVVSALFVHTAWPRHVRLVHRCPATCARGGSGTPTRSPNSPSSMARTTGWSTTPQGVHAGDARMEARGSGEQDGCLRPRRTIPVRCPLLCTRRVMHVELYVGITCTALRARESSCFPSPPLFPHFYPRAACFQRLF